MPKCFGCYKTFLCCVSDCKFANECMKKQAINMLKETKEKSNIDISDKEIVSLVEKNRRN